MTLPTGNTNAELGVRYLKKVAVCALRYGYEPENNTKRHDRHDGESLVRVRVPVPLLCTDMMT